jgi:hypothetical protein
MSEERQAEELVQKLAGTYLKDLVSIVICEVDSVDKKERTCDCTPVNGNADTSIPSVRLCAENNDGFLVFPKVGSTVIVAFSTYNSAFVLMYSDVDSVQFMDGSFKGIVKVIELTEKLNNLETLVNNHLLAYNTHTHLGVTAGFSASGITTPDTQHLTLTTKSDIENPLITHGL